MSNRPITHAILPLLVIFVSVKITVLFYAAFIRSSGGGLKPPFEVDAEALILPDLSGKVTQNDIAGAIPGQFIRIKTDILERIEAALPGVEWVFLASYLLAWLTPMVWFAFHATTGDSLAPLYRKLARIVTASAGILFLFGLLFANGYSVMRPDQVVGAAGGAMLYGVFLLCLFTDTHTKARKWLPRLFIALPTLLLLGTNLMISKTFFGQSVPEFAAIGETVTAAYLSGPSRWLHELISQDNTFVFVLTLLWLSPFMLYDFVKDRIVKRSPALHMVLTTCYCLLTVGLFVLMNGMYIGIPSAMTFGLLGFIWIGMSLFSKFETVDGQHAYTKEKLAIFSLWLEREAQKDTKTRV